jgi:hypothetical protein
MSSSISVIEVDLDGATDFDDASKGSSLLMPEKMPCKLGITKKKYPVEPRLIKN